MVGLVRISSVSLVWFGGFALAGLVWGVWFGTYSLVGLVWFLWFARFGLKAQKENQITFYCPLFSTAMLLEDPGNNFWAG